MCGRHDTAVKTDYEKLRLKANVKNIVETYYETVISDDSIKKGKQTIYLPSFLESSEENTFNSFETELWFNRNGNITECTMRDSIMYIYFKEIFEYKNILLENKIGYISDELSYRQVFEYDSKNRERRRDFYDSENQLFETVSVNYIDKNSVTETVASDYGKAVFEKRITLENGLPVSSVSIIKAKEFEKWTGKYDSAGHIILSKLYDENSNPVQYSVYEYDEFGNETLYASYSADEELIEEYKYMYKYDKFNNWTQRATIVDNIPEIITVRKIDYY
jgi:hypothetical protein